LARWLAAISLIQNELHFSSFCMAFLLNF